LREFSAVDMFLRFHFIIIPRWCQSVGNNFLGYSNNFGEDHLEIEVFAGIIPEKK